ncbi:hypothetical protein KCU62_g2041, partial [Aureobasidium sp. EXF-3399]
MSEPISDTAQPSTEISVHSSRSAMPFIEEDIEIKSEIKAEPTGCIDDDEISIADVKRSRLSPELGPRAYGGGPVKDYVPGTQYKYSRHEAVPELEVNSHHHQKAIENFLYNIREVVLPAISPYKDDDKSIDDMVKWFTKNANVPEIPQTVFALLGNSGSGKTTTLNNLLGEAGLANADASLASVTQNPQLFNHLAGQLVRFSVEVLFLNGRSNEKLIRKCLSDLVKYVRYISNDDAEEENDDVREAAESSRQVFDDLFSDQDGLKSLDDVEEFLETRSLLPQSGEDVSESAVESVHQQIRERASSDGIDLDTREVRLTAGNVGELRAKTARFSERGAFAPLVSSVRTKFHSPLLAMGVEIADLPGYTDTNAHLRQASKDYSQNVSKAVFVADLSRCLTTPELKKSLKQTIKQRGTENVCLVLRGKENVDKSTSKWTKDEISHLEHLEKSLKAAKLQLDTIDDESLAAQATVNVQKCDRHILEYRISVRDRVVTDHFSQKEYRSKHDNSKIRVITVANKCHEQYMLGKNGAILSVDQTGIKELRAYMCEAPSTDRVRAFARHLALCLTKILRVSIWADGPKMPPRDTAMALFEQYTRWSIKEFKSSLTRAVVQYKKSLYTRFTDTWEEAVQKVIDRWIASYAARTQGVFIRQGGRHSPNTKGVKTAAKKQKLVSWPEDLLVVAEDDVVDLLKPTWAAINEVESGIEKYTRNVVDKISRGLKTLDTIGDATLEGVLSLFEDERDLCVRDLHDDIIELKNNLKSTAMKSTADEPCDEDSPIFVRETFKIFKTAFDKFPPKTKNLSKERMKYIREQITTNKGPYFMMSNEIASGMGPVIDK